MLSIDEEIGIERQDEMPTVDFRHANDAGVRQRHRRVPVFLHQSAQCAEMLLDLECNPKRAILDELQDCILRLRVTREQTHRFGEHRLADEERRVELVEALRDPAVAPLRPVEEGDQRPNVNDGRRHPDRSPRDVLDRMRDPELPNRSCRARARSAQRGWRRGAFRAAPRGRAAAPLPRGPGACGRAAPHDI